jgi:outer membrane protein assembly factor BamB
VAVAGDSGAANPIPFDWPAYGRTPQIANHVPAGTLSAERVASFRTIWSRKVDGIVVAQPLFVRDAIVGSRRRSAFVVVTGGNTVYALSADDGTVIWRRSLGPPVATVCGGTAGIASTPAIDRGRGEVYVIGGTGLLYALDLRDGSTRAGWPVRVVSRTSVEYVWGGLRFLGRSLYVPVASHCDRGDARGAWNGRLVTVDRVSRRVAQTFDVVPGPANGGSIWGWGGVSIGVRGRSIYVGTANAVVTRDGNLIEKQPQAERVLRLSPSLRLLGSAVQPDDAAALLGDQGFGSTPLLFKPPGCKALLAVNAKSGYTYVWRRRHLSRPTLLRAQIGPTSSSDGFLAQPTWFPETRMLVVAQAAFGDGAQLSRGVAGFRVVAGCRFRLAWTLNIGGGTQPQPLGVGRVAFVAASAIGKLAAVDTGTGRLLNLLDTGPAYAPPMSANGLVVSAAADGTVRAYGNR